MLSFICGRIHTIFVRIPWRPHATSRNCRYSSKCMWKMESSYHFQIQYSTAVFHFALEAYRLGKQHIKALVPIISNSDIFFK